MNGTVAKVNLALSGLPKFSSVNGDTGLLEVLGALLQLDELRFTERSPTRAAMENHERSSSSTSRVQVDDFSALILQGDVREAAT